MGDYDELHHGDCVGVDEQVALMAHEYRVVAHPPISTMWQSKLTAERNDFVWPPKPFLERNRDIVDVTHLLLVVPRYTHEELRSGTWTTYRYAKEIHRPMKIIYPDGSVVNKTDKTNS